MKKSAWTIALALLSVTVFAQDMPARLAKAYTQFTADSQLRSAMSSLYVVDAATGAVLFDRNGSTGMATASTLKIITAATAYELLGRDFRYASFFLLDKDLTSGKPVDLRVAGSGDPTFGSWRYAQTKEAVMLARVKERLQAKGFQNMPGGIVVEDTRFGDAAIPGGYPWEDVGNYYGAGIHQLNWRENQYDVVFRSGPTGAPATIVSIAPPLKEVAVNNLVTAGPAGSGDNAYIYFELARSGIVITGTIPPDRPSFTVSGALPDPPLAFGEALAKILPVPGKQAGRSVLVKRSAPVSQPGDPAGAFDTLYIHHSPALDSIVYWFLKKSINLYGEALLRTFAYKKNGTGATNKGADIVREFWQDKGIDPTELSIVDGSGLSPNNRVTTHAQVTILQYARRQPWYVGYYDAFPEYNGMKMKSGTIGGVKGFCGYHHAADGHDYIFSFLVNNYHGPSSSLVLKMYRVLDELK